MYFDQVNAVKAGNTSFIHHPKSPCMKLLYALLALFVLLFTITPTIGLAAARSPQAATIESAQISHKPSRLKKTHKRLHFLKKFQSKLDIGPDTYATLAIVLLVIGFALIGIGVVISSGTLAFFLYLLGGIALAEAVWHFILFIIDG